MNWIWGTNLLAAATRVSWVLVGASAMFSSGLRHGFACGPKGCIVIYSTWGLDGDFVDCWMTPEGRTARSGFTALALPLPLATAVGWWIWRQRRARRREAGACVDCGYDLRAAPEWCPECGKHQSEESPKPRPCRALRRVQRS